MNASNIPGCHPGANRDDDLRKRMLAVEVPLEVPGTIPDGLESELYAYRGRL